MTTILSYDFVCNSLIDSERHALIDSFGAMYNTGGCNDEIAHSIVEDFKQINNIKDIPFTTAFRWLYEDCLLYFYNKTYKDLLCKNQ